MSVIPVRVAVRCRPLVAQEQNECCQICVSFVPNQPQLILGKDRAFTYDYVFPLDCSHDNVFTAVQPLLNGFFEGYNATVLAYGQTGSGKTFTMGGAYNVCENGSSKLVGIIPRVVKEIFHHVDHYNNTDVTFDVKVTYLEIYKEDLIDLLEDPSNRTKDSLVIREDASGIKICGLKEVNVASQNETNEQLSRGSASRSTGATAMNQNSSRSHAIFTIHLNKKSPEVDQCFSAKFHLVDLAGSERVKKTKAEGIRFKEGVTINAGLLVLGNVISALGDDSGASRHIPYRDAKLTRLLQDSLGGNSHTLMIACISPADSNMEETLSTLRYADRARKIKNKPVVNRNEHAAEIAKLKDIIKELQSGEKTVAEGQGGDHLQEQLKLAQSRIEELSTEIRQVYSQNAEMYEKLLRVEMSRDNIKGKLEKLRENASTSLNLLNEDDKEYCVQQKEILSDMKATIAELEGETSVQLQNGDGSDDDEADQDISMKIPQHLAKQHIEKQAKMSKELEELNKLLMKKEQLASTMQQNGDEMFLSMKDQHEAERQDLEKKINSLLEEKEELTSRLVALKSTAASRSISEQRRKRLVELEGQLSDLNKKLMRQNKSLKLKEQSEKQVTKLNLEIVNMKQYRVKLMKQMKEEGDQFRKWKSAKDKEVVQLKAQQRKKQAEMAKLQQQNSRQELVLKRKTEEAAAANRRLKEVLHRQKIAADCRLSKQERQGISLKEKTEKWLNEELEVSESVAEAQHHLQEMIAGRTSLAQDIKQLQRKQSVADEAAAACLGVKLESCRRGMAELNEQIGEIQAKIIDSGHEENSLGRWNNIRTMGEAKVALRTLYDWATRNKVLATSLESRVRELNARSEEFERADQEKEELVTLLQKEAQDEVMKLHSEYEDKVALIILKKSDQMDHTVREQLLAQEAKVERLQLAVDELLAENTSLKQTIKTKSYLGESANISLMPEIGTPLSLAFPMKKRKTGLPANFALPKNSISEEEKDESNVVESESESDVSLQGEDNDEEWLAGKTPGYSHRTRVRSKDKVDKARLSKCGCRKGNCQSQRCHCFKLGSFCGLGTCRCSPRVCGNHRSLSNDGENSLTMNSTFDSKLGEMTQLNLNSTFCKSEAQDPEVFHDVTNSSDSKRKSKEIVDVVLPVLGNKRRKRTYFVESDLS